MSRDSLDLGKSSWPQSQVVVLHRLRRWAAADQARLWSRRVSGAQAWPPFSRPTDNTSHTIRIYLDEIAYDRITMLRSRKMLGDSATIDHHADHGFVSASPAMNYMELYPFINRLWCKSDPT